MRRGIGLSGVGCGTSSRRWPAFTASMRCGFGTAGFIQVNRAVVAGMPAGWPSKPLPIVRIAF